MKVLKSLLILVTLSFGLSASALSLGDIAKGIAVIAGGDHGRDGRDYSRPPRPGTRVTCTASDKGWEEHGSHPSCGECLRRHGQCIETCAVNYSTCYAEGKDRQGNRSTFEGRAESRYEAERQAYNSCDRRVSSCRVLGCKDSSETVSTRRCQR